MSDADRIAILADKMACTEVVHRMARGIDRCDAELLRACFHEGATDDHGIVKGTAEEFIAQVIPMLGGMKSTQHLIGQVLVEVAGDDARAEAYFIAQHTLATADGGEEEMFAAGRYLDSLARRDGAWKVTHRQAVYDWTMTVPASGGWDGEPMKSLLLRGARGGDDASAAHFASLRSG